MTKESLFNAQRQAFAQSLGPSRAARQDRLTRLRRLLETEGDALLAAGMGAYHGPEGFKTFSHAHGVFRQSRLSGTEPLPPPYEGLTKLMLKFLLRRWSRS